jgi:hypothetical protein
MATDYSLQSQWPCHLVSTMILLLTRNWGFQNNIQIGYNDIVYNANVILCVSDAFTSYQDSTWIINQKDKIIV